MIRKNLNGYSAVKCASAHTKINLKLTLTGSNTGNCEKHNYVL